MAFFWNIASIPPLHLPQAIPRAPSRFPDRAIAVTGPALTVAHYLVNATQPSRRLFFVLLPLAFISFSVRNRTIPRQSLYYYATG